MRLAWVVNVKAGLEIIQSWSLGNSILIHGQAKAETGCDTMETVRDVETVSTSPNAGGCL